MLGPVSPIANISNDQKRELGQLGRKIVTRMLLAAAGAVGSRLGEKLVDALFPKPGDDGDTDDDDDGEEKGS